MTIKTTNLGGTDWSDGDILYAADLNDTFDATATRILLDSGTFSGNESSSTQKATASIGASIMGASDIFLLEVFSYKDTANVLNLAIRMTENSVLHTGEDSAGSSETGSDYHFYYLYQDPGTNTAMLSLGSSPFKTAERKNRTTGHSANWITGALTFEIWARIVGNYNSIWKLYRIAQ